MPATTTINRAPRLLIATVIIACGTLNLAILGNAIYTRPRLNTDFLAFWSYPRFAAAHPIAGLYTAQTLQNFQQTLYPWFHSFYPFLYPPTFLLATWWLKFCSFSVAQTLWTLAGLALLTAATILLFRRQTGPVLIALLASPASLLNIMTGETAYFTTAFLLAGFALLPKRPLLAGLAFGLLTLKPQLGVLVPFALLARGDWRAILSASAVALSLIALSCLAFPASLWAVWARTLPVYQAQYFTGPGLNLNIIVTPMANLITLGLAPSLAGIAQTIISLLTTAAVFCCFRGANDQRAVAALLGGGFLAVPHAYAYDTITLTAAMALCLSQIRHPPAALLALGLLLYLAPLLLLTPAHHWFLYAVPETLLFIPIIMLARGQANRAIIADEPNHHRPCP